MKHKNIILIVSIIMSNILFACKNEEIFDAGFKSVTPKVEEISLNTNSLRTGETLNVGFKLKNETKYPISIKSITAIVENLYENNKELGNKVIASNIIIEPGEISESISAEEIFEATGDITPSSFCKLSFKLDLEDGVTSKIDGTYFRVIGEESLIVYDIMKEDYNGIPIYKQKGDMSAAFAVTKSLTALHNGMSGTMLSQPEGGTYPVYATPEFLIKSVQKTVDLYNQEIGENTEIENVVIGTGLSSVGHLVSAMKAAFLPIHFLVSANCTKEIKDIMAYSTEKGYPCYATFGYDGSMPRVGVAWIKLLSLPEEYKKFIIDHKVKNVIIYGDAETTGGETFARKVLNHNETSDGYKDNDLYILYTQYGSDADISAIKQRIYDYDDLILGEGHNIADWEAGVIDIQRTNFAKAINETTSAKVVSIMSPSGKNLSMYNIAPFSTMKFMEKNNIKPSGFIFNEYLTCHPQYEIYKGWIPLLYWQFNPAIDIVNRLYSDLSNGMNRYFQRGYTDENSFYNINSEYTYYLSSNFRRYELKDVLINKGVNESNIIIRQSEDKWNPSDDNEDEEYLGQINKKIGAVEEFTYDIVNNIGFENYKNSVNKLSPLNIEDLHEMAQTMNDCGMDITITEY